MKRKSGILVAVFFLAMAAPAQAEKYRVDLILFADKTGVGDESPTAFRPQDFSRALEPTDTARLRTAGIELVPEAEFGLLEEWRKLSNSQRQQPLLRLAWVQKDPPSERAVSLRLRSGNPLSAAGDGSGAPVYPVDGTVALLLGRFLHLDADLAYNLLNSSGEPRSYQLKERRRLRRKELHHLDSPRLGLLARVEKVKGEAEKK